MQLFSLNFARLSAIWESNDCKTFFQIQISHRNIDSKAAESRAEFERNTCSTKIPNNLLYEIRLGTRFRLGVFRFLRHQSPSLSPLSTLRGVAEVRTLKLDFILEQWRNKNKKLGGGGRVLIPTLYRYQNRKKLLGHMDTFTASSRVRISRLLLTALVNCSFLSCSQLG